MRWKCILADVDVVCYQKSRKSYAVRIEARRNSEKWKIYKSYYNDRGLNVIDSFEAKDREEMESIMDNLQSQKDPSINELRRRMTDAKKSLSVRMERAFKEYNVEKWSLIINDDPAKCTIFVRYFDAIEMDFIMPEKYAPLEETITNEIIRILGLQSEEEDITISFFYYSSSSRKNTGNSREKFVHPQFEFDWSDD